MKVVDHEPQTWFLLTDCDRYYLDARVTRSAVDWSVLIELNEQEYREYHAIGRSYLAYLAARIHNFTEDYTGRDLTRSREDEVLGAIRAWHRGSREVSGGA